VSDFERFGLVHRAGVVPADEIRAMRDCLQRALPALVEIDGAMRPEPVSAPAMAEVVERPVFDSLAAHLARALDDELGANQWAPASGPWRGLALPNHPIATRSWDVPHRHWHTDEPTIANRARPFCLGAFVFLDRVVAGGGATVAMSGSPRRLRALAPELAPTLEELGRVEPWVRALLAPGPDPERRRRQFMIEGCVSDGVPLRVVELIGAPGDVVFMDLRCLHAPSANAGGAPRLVVKMACNSVGE